MKVKSLYPLALLAWVLTLGGTALAQSSRIPGPTDYTRFSRFIAERNIFDPNRTPPTGSVYHPTFKRRAGAPSPAFAFVGTMVYGKGMFAFFDGNNDLYRKSLQVSGKIAGYTVTNITLTHVDLVAADGKILSVPVGGLMKIASDGTWVLSNESADFSGQTDSVAPAGSATGGTSGSSNATPSAPPASSGEVSDVLKRLMKLREQENK